MNTATVDRIAEHAWLTVSFGTTAGIGLWADLPGLAFLTATLAALFLYSALGELWWELGGQRWGG